MADLTHDPHDDDFHEIHLTGKQVVFLCMATTVISVVIFLCGVAVGKSVQSGGFDAGMGVLAAQSEEPGGDEVLPEPDPIAEAQPGPPLESQTDYQQRLTAERPRTEPLRRPDPPAESTPAAEKPAPDPRPETRAPEWAERAASDLTAGARPGTWAVQVISLQNRGAAERIVRRLRTKQYPAYLIEPAPGDPGKLYKVQVGRYGDRAEAEKVEARLKKEEQFDTWIVR